MRRMVALVLLIAGCTGIDSSTTLEASPSTTAVSTTRATATTQPTTTTSIVVGQTAIRTPTEEQLADYVLAAVLFLNGSAFNAQDLDPNDFVLMLREGALGACTALETGASLSNAMKFGLANIPEGLPDPYEPLNLGMSLAHVLVTNGVEAYCPDLDTAPDAIDLTNAWFELTDVPLIDRDKIIEDGTWVVGTDVQPGTYRDSAGGGCYWERLSGFGGTLDDVIANGFSEEQQIVEIESTDAGFVSEGCGTWFLEE